MGSRIGSGAMNGAIGATPLGGIALGDQILWPPADEPEEPSALIPIDGGPDYFSQFPNSLPTSADYFPLGVWFQNTITQGDIDSDQSVGYNLYVVLAGDSSWDLIEASGMKTFPQQDYWLDNPVLDGKTSVAGWFLRDEIDMQQDPSTAFPELETAAASVPTGSLTYSNYGKGVMFWNEQADAIRYINDFQHVSSADVYWFTDPFVHGASEGGKLLNGGADLTTDQTRRAANYGYTVDRVRALDAASGIRRPVWNYIELGWAFSETAEQGARTIEPAEVKAAVWHSIIAGARGIVYFNSSFGGPNFSFSCTREPAYAAVAAAVTETNALITQLAPVLNSPTETGYASASSSVRATVKNSAGQRWIFAGSKENVASTATFALTGVASGTAVVEDEDRTITIAGGQFSDDFADGNAVHIYRIEPS